MKEKPDTGTKGAIRYNVPIRRTNRCHKSEPAKKQHTYQSINNLEQKLVMDDLPYHPLPQIQSRGEINNL